MTLLKTKVNIVFKLEQREPRAARAITSYLGMETAYGARRWKFASMLTFCVAINPQTTTFREPFGRSPRCDWRSGA